jgi:CBS domain-containing protein
MVKVKDVMTKDVITFSPDASVYDCAKILREQRISGAPAVEEGKGVVGILSEGDIMKLIESKDININLILPSPLDVLELPVRMKLALDDIVKNAKGAASAKVGDVMTKRVVTISSEEEISKAARIMADEKINRLPVVDENGELVGIITRGDVIGAI